MSSPDKTMVMAHDDDCTELLDQEGKCPTCNFHPDMQSTAFRAVPIEEIDALRATGRTFLGLYREKIGAAR